MEEVKEPQKQLSAEDEEMAAIEEILALDELEATNEDLQDLATCSQYIKVQELECMIEAAAKGQKS